MTEVEWADVAESIDFERVLDELGIRVLEVKKGEHIASCPLPTHPGLDANPSFSVSETKLLFNCYTCGTGGYLPQLVVELDFASDWDDAVLWLLPFSDADPDADPTFLKQIERYLERPEKPPKRIRKPTLPRYTEKVFEGLKLAPMEIMARWGIKEERTVETFGVRYDPERTVYGGKNKEEEFTGDALIIPHYFEGALVGFQTRWMPEDRPKWLPKYVNTKGFPKNETLFNWDRAVQDAREGCPIIVIESSMTTMRLFELDYPSTASFGAQVTDQQLRLLSSITPGVIVSSDNDPDFLNAKGQWVAGAGRVNLHRVGNFLAPLIPVWELPAVDKEKGDLADLSDEEIEATISARKPYTPTKIQRIRV